MNKLVNKIKECCRKYRNFLVFGLIGGFNTLAAQVIYMIAVSMSIAPGTSSVLGDGLTIISSYFLNMAFTYHKKPSWKSFITFPFSYVPGLIINMLMVILFVDVLAVPKIYAKLFSLPITIPLNYLFVTLIVKKTTKEQEEQQVNSK